MKILLVFGYIDPMSGAILIQLIVAGGVACAMFFRRSIWRLVRFVVSFCGKRSNADSKD